jgi:hypothetical protein
MEHPNGARLIPVVGLRAIRDSAAEVFPLSVILP